MILDRTFFVSLVGSDGCGKTTYLNRLCKGEFSNVSNTNLYKIKINTNNGLYDIHISDGMLDDTDGIIYMYDCNNKEYMTQMSEYSCNPDIIIGNKYDMCNENVPDEIKGVRVYGVSSKTNYNLEKTILYFLKQLTGKNDLKICNLPPIEPQLLSF